LFQLFFEKTFLVPKKVFFWICFAHMSFLLACGNLKKKKNTIIHLFFPFFSAFCFSDSSVSCVDHWTGKLLLTLIFCLAFI